VIGTIYVDVPYLTRFEHRARGMSFLSHQPRASILAGRHGSRVRGRGLDFEELRAYVPGDDIRTIDWKVTLRTGKAQVRAYTEERDRPALFVVDQRIPMFFGSRRAMKSVIAAELGALGAWIVFQSGDRAGAIVFNDDTVQRIRPLRSRERVHAILGAISAMNGRLEADSGVQPAYDQLNHALESALQIATHDHLICIISDFAGADRRTQDLLRQLAAHNDVLATLVFDPGAQSMPGTGRLVVTGGELQVELDFAKGAVREPLESLFSGRLHAVGELLRRSGVPLLAINTEQDSVAQLQRLLGRQSRRAAI